MTSSNRACDHQEKKTATPDESGKIAELEQVQWIGRDDAAPAAPKPAAGNQPSELVERQLEGRYGSEDDSTGLIVEQHAEGIQDAGATEQLLTGNQHALTKTSTSPIAVPPPETTTRSGRVSKPTARWEESNRQQQEGLVAL